MLIGLRLYRYCRLLRNGSVRGNLSMLHHFSFNQQKKNSLCSIMKAAANGRPFTALPIVFSFSVFLAVLSVARGQSCPGFSKIAEFDGPIRTLEVGFSESSCPDEPFQYNRIIWTVEPAPPGSTVTTVFSSPPGLVEAYRPVSARTNQTIPNWIMFRPDEIWNVPDAEVGVLVQVPKDDLDKVVLALFENNNILLDVKDGFTQLRRIMGGRDAPSLEPSVLAKAGEGATVRATVLQSENPLEMKFTANKAMSIQVEATAFQSLDFSRCPNAVIELKGNLGVRGEEERTSNFDASGGFCPEDGDQPTCGLSIVLLEGEIIENVALGVSLYFIVNDPSSNFDCGQPSFQSDNLCVTTEGGVLPNGVQALPCTNVPQTYLDVSYCNLDVPGPAWKTCNCAAVDTDTTQKLSGPPTAAPTRTTPTKTATAAPNVAPSTKAPVVAPVMTAPSVISPTPVTNAITSTPTVVPTATMDMPPTTQPSSSGLPSPGYQDRWRLCGIGFLLLVSIPFF